MAYVKAMIASNELMIIVNEFDILRTINAYPLCNAWIYDLRYISPFFKIIQNILQLDNKKQEVMKKVKQKLNADEELEKVRNNRKVLSL